MTVSLAHMNIVPSTLALGTRWHYNEGGQNADVVIVGHCITHIRPDYCPAGVIYRLELSGTELAQREELGYPVNYVMPVGMFLSRFSPQRENAPQPVQEEPQMKENAHGEI